VRNGSGKIISKISPFLFHAFGDAFKVEMERDFYLLICCEFKGRD